MAFWKRLAAFITRFRLPSTIRRPVLWIVFCQLLFISIAETRTSFFHKKPSPFSIVHRIEKDRGPHFCEGRMTRPPESLPEATTLWVALSACADPAVGRWERVEGVVRLRVAGPLEQLEKGDRVRFSSTFRLPHDFGNAGSFRVTRHFRTAAIDATGFMTDSRWVARLPAVAEPGGAAILEKTRRHLRESVVRKTSPEASSFLLSLLIGDRARLGAVAEDSFRKAGVSHILSISGLHVVMIAALFLLLFRFLGQPFFKRSVLWLRFYPAVVLIPVWLYVALAGFPVSAVRAGMMASLVLLGLSLWRRADPLSCLALAAFSILLVSPLSLFGASFQLSFMAVLFLILFFPPWRRFLARFPKCPTFLKWLLDALAISAITLAGVVPILLWHFHEVSLAGLVSNLVVVPLVNLLVMPFGLLGAFTGFWKPAGFFADLCLKAVDGFAAHADGWIFNGAVSFWALILYYAAVAALFFRRWAVGGICVALIFLGGMMPGDSRLRVTFVDVGQGDCAVIRLPNGKVWVVDGGGIKGSDWDVGRFVVAPFLWEEGIRKIDALFLSHPHHDHYKGLGYLVEHFDPKVLYTNGDNAPISEDKEWQDFLRKVGKGGLRVEGVTRKTEPVTEGEVRTDFWMPGPHGTVPHFDTNDNSVVMKLNYGNISFLLPGDLMEMGELLLMESRPDLKADVLKTGHHGSDTSTKADFLKAVQPHYAVISAGAYNAYGVPDEAVLERLQKAGVRVFRTDQQGAITFATDGNDIFVETFVKY